MIDTNKIVSSLLKDGVVRRILYLSDIILYTPKHATDELNAHFNEILRKMKNIDREVIETIFSQITGRIIEIDIEKKYLREALKIAEEFDEKDAPFIALALKLNIPLWTNDKGLLKYSFISKKYVAVDTIALKEIISGKDVDIVLESLENRLFKSS